VDFFFCPRSSFPPGGPLPPFSFFGCHPGSLPFFCSPTPEYHVFSGFFLAREESGCGGSFLPPSFAQRVSSSLYSDFVRGGKLLLPLSETIFKGLFFVMGRQFPPSPFPSLPMLGYSDPPFPPPLLTMSSIPFWLLAETFLRHFCLSVVLEPPTVVFLCWALDRYRFLFFFRTTSEGGLSCHRVAGFQPCLGTPP